MFSKLQGVWDSRINFSQVLAMKITSSNGPSTWSYSPHGETNWATKNLGILGFTMKTRSLTLSGYVKIAYWKWSIYSWFFLLRIVIFHSYVSLPEGTMKKCKMLRSYREKLEVNIVLSIRHEDMWLVMDWCQGTYTRNLGCYLEVRGFSIWQWQIPSWWLVCRGYSLTVLNCQWITCSIHVLYPNMNKPKNEPNRIQPHISADRYSYIKFGKSQRISTKRPPQRIQV